MPRPVTAAVSEEVLMVVIVEKADEKEEARLERRRLAALVRVLLRSLGSYEGDPCHFEPIDVSELSAMLNFAGLRA